MRGPRSAGRRRAAGCRAGPWGRRGVALAAWCRPRPPRPAGLTTALASDQVFVPRHSKDADARLGRSPEQPRAGRTDRSPGACGGAPPRCSGGCVALRSPTSRSPTSRSPTPPWEESAAAFCRRFLCRTAPEGPHALGCLAPGDECPFGSL